MVDLDVAAHQAVDEKLGIIPSFSVKSQKIVWHFFDFVFVCSLNAQHLRFFLIYNFQMYRIAIMPDFFFTSDFKSMNVEDDVQDYKHTLARYKTL